MPQVLRSTRLAIPTKPSGLDNPQWIAPNRELMIRPTAIRSLDLSSVANAYAQLSLKPPPTKIYDMFLRLTLLTAAIAAVLASPTYAQPGRDKEELSWDRNMSRIFSRYCHRCHNDEKAQGGVNLKRDTDLNMVLNHRDVWLKVGEQLEYGAMPPEDAKQPDAHEAELMLQFINTMVRKIDCGDCIEPGRPVLRRLNRVEYGRSVQSLFGIDPAISEVISADTVAFGFDNIADAMSLTPTQIEQYAQAANLIAEHIAKDAGKKSNAQLAKLFKTDQGDFRSLKPDAADTQAQQVIQRLIDQAFRRPSNEKDLQPVLKIYQAARDAGRTPAESMSNVIRAVVLSPRFLFRIEQLQPKQTEPYLVDSYDMLSRLSFFFWSAPPTPELSAFAKQHDLKKLDVLQDFAKNMLQSPKAKNGLYEQFVLQWLRLGALLTHNVDSKTFPEFQSSLLKDMQLEVIETVHATVQNGGKIGDLLEADSVYINARLADHYGLRPQYDAAQAASKNSDFRKVNSGDSKFGGLATSGAIMVSTADPFRTNVPRRGNYFASVFFGDPPPPPPPEVPELDTSSAATANLTLREKLEQHRANPQCANCHAKMDPIGFAFENFDAVGRWRELDANKPIDASGELEDGSKFNGPAEFKKLMLNRREQIGTHLLRQMLIYALGRGLTVSDECTVQNLVEQAKASDWKLESMILSVATCDAMRYRTNPDY